MMKRLPAVLESALIHLLVIALVVGAAYLLGKKKSVDVTDISLNGGAESKAALKSTGAESTPAPFSHKQAAAPHVKKTEAASEPSPDSTPSRNAPTRSNHEAIGVNPNTGSFAKGQAETNSQGSTTQAETDLYIQDLKNWIDGRKYYPVMSARIGETGTVEVQFTVARNGLIGNVVLKRSSSFSRLDNAAIHLLSDAGIYRPLPASITAPSLTVEIPIEYSRSK
jgi:TonB family protein